MLKPVRVHDTFHKNGNKRSVPVLLKVIYHENNSSSKKNKHHREQTTLLNMQLLNLPFATMI